MITFLHGFLGMAEDWNEIQKHIAVPSRTLTLPGHKGRTLDLASFEEEIGSGVTLVGYSMGGRLAMHYALKNPERVQKLILLSTNPGEGGEERIAKDEQWAQCLEKEGMDPFLDKWYAQEMFKDLKINKERRRHDPQMLAQMLRKFSPARLPNLWPKLQEFSCPVVFLFGRNDIKYRLIGKKLNKQFPVAWIERSGHAIHLENPKACAKCIMEAL